SDALSLPESESPAIRPHTTVRPHLKTVLTPVGFKSDALSLRFFPHPAIRPHSARRLVSLRRRIAKTPPPFVVVLWLGKARECRTLHTSGFCRDTPKNCTRTFSVPDPHRQIARLSFHSSATARTA